MIENPVQQISAGACLHLIDTGGPGGAETMFQQMVARLDGRPLRSLAVVPREGWLAAKLRAGGIEPRILNVRGSVNLRYLAKLVALARAEHVRIIHAHLLGSSVYGALLGAILRVPVIAVIHGPTDLRSPGRFLGFKRFLLRQACSRLIAVSQGTRDALREFGIEEERIAVIPNGIDVDAFSPQASTALRETLRIPADDILVGAVGNIRAPKAYDVLLRAASIILARSPRVHFVVVGEGSEQIMQPLLKLRDDLGIQRNFHFAGFQKTDAALFGNFDVFVSSSRSEGLPLSFLEAMASGRPVVATRSGGAQEVITDTESGMLVPIEDPPALADALERVIGDKALRSALGTAGRDKVLREFNLNLTIDKYARLHHELLGLSFSTTGAESS